MIGQTKFVRHFPRLMIQKCRILLSLIIKFPSYLIEIVRAITIFRLLIVQVRAYKCMVIVS